MKYISAAKSTISTEANRTKVYSGRYMPEELLEEQAIVSTSPMKHLKEPQDVANIFAVLVSESNEQ